MRKLTDEFIPAADEVSRLERGRGAASDMFRGIASRHFDRLQTTQGTYIVTPGGELLAFGNVMNPDAMTTLLQDGLAKWKALPSKERSKRPTIKRGAENKSAYPEDGLALNVVLRKIYKPSSRRRRGRVEWNQDYAWFTKKEAARFVPKKLKKGSFDEVPASVLHRLARLHFSDTVRAFADPYPAECIKEARLTSTIVRVQKNLVTLGFKGRVHLAQDNVSRFGFTRESSRLPRKSSRSYDADLLGSATYDLRRRCFTEFELIAYGRHTGGGQRQEEPEAMGVLMTLAGTGSIDRVAPRHLDLYDWQ